MEEIKETCYKGTRILLGNEKRLLIQKMTNYLMDNGFVEIHIPIIQHAEIFSNKVGNENQNMMFGVIEPKGRNLCLAPEYTAIIQHLAKTTFKNEKNLKIFYVQECFRGEKPQAGRYRQFTQLGVEIINPTSDYMEKLTHLARVLIEYYITPCSNTWYKEIYLNNLTINTDVIRGLDYYKEGKGFEIAYKALGASKQICGGGEYDGGAGFAIGIDRLLNIKTDE